MNEKLRSRINQILPLVTSEQFLSGKGLGNEIAFYIFDYAPEDEIQVRDQIEILEDHIRRTKPEMSFESINLFEFLISFLKEKNLLEKSFHLQKEKGNKNLLSALKGVLSEEKVAKLIADKLRPGELDLVFLHGVGSCYPLIRSHTLLNNLHPYFSDTPLVLFYPGRYDKTSLRLFGKSGLSGDTSEGSRQTANYYRAFKLIE